MKTRIIVDYLIKEGYDATGDRNISLDEYTHSPVSTVEEGRKLIEEFALHGNGNGTITEQIESIYGWEDATTHYVDGGLIYRTENH